MKVNMVDMVKRCLGNHKTPNSSKHLKGVELLRHVNKHPAVIAAKQNKLGIMDRYSQHHLSDVVKDGNQSHLYY
jgi:hypothetical protein